MTFPKLLKNAGIYLLLALGLLITVAPFLLSLMTAFKTPSQFANQPALSVPNPFTGENFSALFSGDRNFIAPVVVTAQVVVAVVIGQLVFSVLAAYAFARVEFRFRDGLFWIYLGTLMVPQVVTIIPLYTMFSQLGLRNTFWGLVLPFLFGSPYAIFLLREYFRSIPEDLISAARLDGAGTMRILWSVVIPLSKPILSTLTIITVVSHWNNFLWPLIITSGKTWQTVTVATAGLQTQYNGNWTLVMAATTVAMAPLLILFAIFQKNIISSIAITGFK
ncbi:multiple sugar transport system permease protein [Psychromicrobium silvestre]|uniref:Multiple sugar transport system permease protein n=1 Tax=Psychromicrobium silvestre TaxID=1645614 RepID=A0A7Y9LT92_9MICC|nr:carbohydrate ABC transporter permease [Psychromicrobium silvestre]NYE95214.1 multiple sugar transport system permease protein [Psychromicrobium silvestre]